MRLFKLTTYLLGLTALTTLFSCNNEEYKEIDNGVYINEAAPSNKFNQQVESELVDEDAIEKKLNIRLAKPVDQDVTVTLDLDASMIDAYNKKNGTNYQMLPSEFMEMDNKTVTIPAGEVTAAPLLLTIKPYTTPNSESYAVPVRITSVSGPVSVTGSADRLLFLLSSPNKQQSIILKGTTSSSVEFKSDIPTSEFTFEYWVKFNNTIGYSVSKETWEGPNYIGYRRYMFADNSAPIYLEGNEQFLLRFWADGAKKIAPTLQCQMDGAYFDSSEFWYPDTWYHIAYTYDGKVLTLYKDGVMDNSKEVTKSFTFKKLLLFINCTYSMEAEFAQIRLWTKCLNASTLQNGMTRQVPVDSEGLAGYWKCDEGEGMVLKDYSANGNDLTLSGTPRWSGKVYNFSHPNN